MISDVFHRRQGVDVDAAAAVESGDGDADRVVGAVARSNVAGASVASVPNPAVFRNLRREVVAMAAILGGGKRSASTGHDTHSAERTSMDFEFLVALGGGLLPRGLGFGASSAGRRAERKSNPHRAPASFRAIKDWDHRGGEALTSAGNETMHRPSIAPPSRPAISP